MIWCIQGFAADTLIRRLSVWRGCALAMTVNTSTWENKKLPPSTCGVSVKKTGVFIFDLLRYVNLHVISLVPRVSCARGNFAMLLGQGT